jgi:hypothetical protein
MKERKHTSLHTWRRQGEDVYREMVTAAWSSAEWSMKHSILQQAGMTYLTEFEIKMAKSQKTIKSIHSWIRNPNPAIDTRL